MPIAQMDILSDIPIKMYKNTKYNCMGNEMCSADTIISIFSFSLEIPDQTSP